MTNQNPNTQLMDIAARIRDMREILGYSIQKMAELTGLTEETYRLYESGNVEMLCGKIKYLLDKPTEQLRLGMAAYRTITEEWSAETAALRFVELAGRIMAGERRPFPFEDGPCSKAEILDERWDEE